MRSDSTSTTIVDTVDFEQLRRLVEVEFDIEEAFIERNSPTFYVASQQDSKQAFIQLHRRLSDMNLAPVLRKRGARKVLKIIVKPQMKPSRPIVNVILLLATVATTLVTGYILSMGWTARGLMSDSIVGAVMFTTAIMGILGSHEMGHKLAARSHNVESSYPYFIPGPPAPFGIGTFGAVIQQKSLAPNRDALFDLGMSGPVVGFAVTIFVTIIGTHLSVLIHPENGQYLPIPLLYRLIINVVPASGGEGNVIWLHPVAFAGWVGMLVTMLNLVPVGMFDGGHVARVLLSDKARDTLSAIAVAALLLVSWPMAIIAFLLARYPHPGSLDEVSSLSTSRKLVTIALVVIFILSVAPISPLF